MIKYGPKPTERAPPTAEDIAARRRMAQNYVMEGSSGAPVEHWTQAVNRGLQGLSGNMMLSQAATDGAAREQFDERQAMARRAAESELAFQNKKKWAEYERNLPLTESQQLDLDYRRAQIGKLQREASDAGTTYGKSGSIFQGQDGRFYSIQFGGDGSRVILPLEVPGAQPQTSQAPQQPMADGPGRFAAPALGGQPAARPAMPLTPARGVSVVGDQMYDNATGGAVRSVGANLFEGERQKDLGKGHAASEMALPKLQRALQSYELKSDNVNRMIDTALSQAGALTTGFVGSAMGRIPGTPAHDLSKTLTGIKANLGFETLQDMRDNSPTGGALGQVSNIELELLQAAWGSVEQSQSEAQLRENLEAVKRIKAQFIEAKRMAYEQDVQRFGAENVPNPAGAAQPTPPASAPRVRSYNPQTGRLE